MDTCWSRRDLQFLNTQLSAGQGSGTKSLTLAGVCTKLFQALLSQPGWQATQVSSLESAPFALSAV